MPADDVTLVASRLDAATSLTVITGAGVSAPSGVPTFRGPQGLWKNRRPEQLATPEAFASDPNTVWEWYNWRREQLAGCQPNDAHLVLARWSRASTPATVITQNVDGLHERADTACIIRFHGSIWELRCWQHCAASETSWWDDTVPLVPCPPRCPHCTGIARPGVVWFGESIPQDILTRSLRAAHCDVFLTIGTSAVVHPAASLVHRAKQHGAFTVEINLEPTPASDDVDISLQGSADQILLAIDEHRTT